MSMADELRQYAEDALRWAEQSKTASEKQALIELARTWSQAAVQIGRTRGPSDEPQAQRMP
jgi:phage-related minor tail protein